MVAIQLRMVRKPRAMAQVASAKANVANHSSHALDYLWGNPRCLTRTKHGMARGDGRLHVHASYLRSHCVLIVRRQDETRLQTLLIT
jgi:hypothetical protein